MNIFIIQTKRKRVKKNVRLRVLIILLFFVIIRKMLELYWTKNVNLHRKVEILIERKLGKTFVIKRTENGKPYITGNPLYFSLSHSHDHAVIALCDKPIGIDIEYYDENGRLKNFTHILSRYTEREKQWISDDFTCFFINWVAKEAYIKMVGGTLAHYLRRLEFYDYRLYLDGGQIGCFAVIADLKAGIYSVCAEGYTNGQLFDCPLKRFRLKKGESL